MTIQAKIYIGTAVVHTAAVRIHRTMGSTAGACEAAIPASVRFRAQPGDTLAAAITVKADSREQTVFTGKIDCIDTRGFLCVIRALDSRVLAARLRVSEVYEQEASDAIIRDLAEQAEVPVAKVARGISLPSYWADDGRNALAHMDYLATLSGSYLYVNKAGKLATTAPVPLPPSLRLQYGTHLLTVSAQMRQGGGAVEVRTQGAASARGSQAAFWPSTDSARAAGRAPATDGTKERQYRPELRSMSAATRVAAARASRRKQGKTRIHLVCLGLPGIELGDAVQLADIPGQPRSQTLRVLAIAHELSAQSGFITELGLEGVGV